MIKRCALGLLMAGGMCLSAADAAEGPKRIACVREIPNWAPRFERTFGCRAAKVERATLEISALGCADVTLNGRRVTDDVLDPPFSNYERTIYSRTYEVAELLGPTNRLAVTVGGGWFAQNLVWANENVKYGPPNLWARLTVDYADGAHEEIATAADGLWTARPSETTFNNIYAGETFDARLKDDAGADLGVRTLDGWPAPEASSIPPIRPWRMIPAKAVTTADGTRNGVFVYDFGEILAGTVELQLPRMVPGACVEVRLAETTNACGALDHRSTGSFATHNLQTLRYIARGDPDGERWRPRFSYGSFRFAELSGFVTPEMTIHDRPPTNALMAVELSTDVAETGFFTCDDSETMKLLELAKRTYRDNLHGYPEDCPAREKGGWLGDAQLVCAFALNTWDVAGLYRKYLRDIRESSELAGLIPFVVPGRRSFTYGEATPLWSAAAIEIPCAIRRYTGDGRALDENRALIDRCLRDLARKADADGIVNSGLGDWLPPGGNGNPRRMPVAHSSTIEYYRLATLVGDEPLARRIRAGFNRRFWRGDEASYGFWGSDAAALATGICPEGRDKDLAAALVRRMKADDLAMPLGIFGVKMLMEAACRHGFQDLALDALLNPRHPGYATMMRAGFTRLPEQLDATLVGADPAKGVPSFNHPMFASFLEFLYERAAGIRPLADGYRRFTVDPVPFVRYSRITARRITPQGEIAVEIERTEDGLDCRVVVPEGTTCEAAGRVYGSGTHRFLVK